MLCTAHPSDESKRVAARPPWCITARHRAQVFDAGECVACFYSKRRVAPGDSAGSVHVRKIVPTVRGASPAPELLVPAFYSVAVRFAGKDRDLYATVLLHARFSIVRCYRL